MPPWELKALEYIIAAVLLGLVLIVATNDKPFCREDLPWQRTSWVLPDPETGLYETVLATCEPRRER